MNGQRLGPTVADWLKGSEVPPKDVRRGTAAVLAAARRQRQDPGWRRWTSLSHGLRRASLVTGPTAVAIGVVLLLLAASGLLSPLTRPQQEIGVGAASPAPRAPADGFRWQTERILLEADDITVAASGLIFRPGGVSLEIDSDPGDAAYWTLEAEWFEHGMEQRIYLYFASDDEDWWITEARTYDGIPPVRWASRHGERLRTPLGEPYRGDLELEMTSVGREDGLSSNEPVVLRMDGLELTVVPLAADVAIVDALPQVVVDGLRGIRDVVAPRPTPRATSAPAPVTIPFGDGELRGERLGGGVVRVLSDGTDNDLSRIVDVAVTDDGRVHVAVFKRVMTLGVPGHVKTTGGGPGRVRDLKVLPEGGLAVDGQHGLMRLDGADWEELPTESIAPEPPSGYRPIELLDGSAWAVAANGRSVAHREGGRWVTYPFDRLFSGAPSRLPAQDVSLRLAGDGDVWMTVGFVGADGWTELLAHYDGVAWDALDSRVLSALLGVERVGLGDLAAGPDGIAWVEASTDSLPQLLRYENGVWTATPMAEITAQAGVGVYDVQQLAPGLEPGSVQLYGSTRPAERFTLEYDGERVVSVDRPAFAVRAVGADGTRWGTGPQARDGLLMLPAPASEVSIDAAEPVGD